MKKFIFLLAFYFVLLSHFSFSQLFVNGSFETITSCGINLLNADFNSRVSNVNAFGGSLYGGVENIDILDNISCIGLGTAQNGNVFLALCQRDAVAVQLSATAIAGVPFSFSFYQRVWSPVASTAALLSIGYSNDPNTPGTVVYTTSQPSVLDVWELVTVSFTPTSNFDYITIQADASVTGWTQIDALQASASTPPPAPVATVPSLINCTGFNANWDVVPGALGYYLDVATDATFLSFVTGYNGFDVGNVTTYPVSGLTNGTTYYYRVRAYNDDGTSANSNEISYLLSETEPPVALCTNHTVYLDGTGLATIVPADIDNGSTDNCGIASYSLSKNTFDCSDVSLPITTTYDILAANLTTPSFSIGCAPTTMAYAQTFTGPNYGFNWTDATPPTAVITNIQLEISWFLNCNSDPSAELNGQPYGILAKSGTNCSGCGSPVVINSYSLNSLIPAYNLGGANNFNIILNWVNFEGIEVNPAWGMGNDVYARVHITYALPPAPIILTVNDINGNSSTCSSIVTVLDTIHPIITCPGDISVNNDPGVCDAVVNYVTPVGTDNCLGAITVQTAGLPSGSTFPVGVTTNTFEVTDGSGLTSSCSFTVTVTDNQNPTASFPVTPGLLYDNGPLVNSPGTGSGGADESMLQNNSLGMSTIGYGVQLGMNNRCADQFTITDPTGWTLQDLKLYCYQTNSTTTSTIDHVNLIIWDGMPGSSNIVFGDNSTNRLTNSVFSNIYRVTETTIGNTARPIMENTVDLGGLSLAPGTYYLDWQIGGTLASGPWQPPVTISGQTTTGDGLQSISGSPFSQVVDMGGQGLPFKLTGFVNGIYVVTAPNDPAACTANMTLIPPATNDNCGISTIVNDFNNTADASGVYPVDTTTVVWTVTDVNGLTTTIVQDIIVNDTEAPVITCPDDISVSTSLTTCDTTGLLIGTPITTDNCGIATVTNDAPLTFPLGFNTVTWTVTDIHGNTATCPQYVNVFDGVPPTINCAPDVTVNNDPGVCEATNVNIGFPATFDNCTVVSITNDYGTKNIILNMFDNWGDGWNGGNLSVYINSLYIGNYFVSNS
ncbi:MAG: HYR domain-containing protein [Bacteroidales bacterium]|nr:HYR domain-containing protein [Bacteroidales bacterium]